MNNFTELLSVEKRDAPWLNDIQHAIERQKELLDTLVEQRNLAIEDLLPVGSSSFDTECYKFVKSFSNTYDFGTALIEIPSIVIPAVESKRANMVVELNKTEIDKLIKTTNTLTEKQKLNLQSRLIDKGKSSIVYSARVLKKSA